MNENSERDFAEWLKESPAAASDLPIVKPEEMLTCGKCGRKTPPTRPQCFYCGNELPLAEIKTRSVKLKLRRLEDWEKGFNIIVSASYAELEGEKIVTAARLLELESEDLAKISASRKTLPVARVETENQARIILERLSELGFESRVVTDEMLKPETPARRLRGIEIFENKLILKLFNNAEIAEINLADIALIVVGAIFERKIESIESIRKKECGKILDSSEIGSDEMLIDLYPKDDFTGFRIEMKGFDFSCLGAEKSLLAKENIKKLAEKLKFLASAAKFDDDYIKIRAELGRIWEASEITDAGGVDRKSFGKFQRTNTLIINNLLQFTKYSRLQKQIL